MRKNVKEVKNSGYSKIKECVISSFILLFAFIIILLFSPFFDITSIKVKGHSKLNENIIRSESGIVFGQNILRLNKRSVEDRLLSISYIESVSIKREWPDTIVIEVTEKEPVAMVELLGSNIIIDEEAYILEIVTDDENYNIPLLSNIETFSTVTNAKLDCNNQELLEKYLEVLKNLKNNDMLKNIVKIENEEEDILLYTDKGNVANIGDISDLHYKMMRLKAVMAKSECNLYIDVSNVNIWPVSKPLWK